MEAGDVHQPSAQGRCLLLGVALVAASLVVVAGAAGSSPAVEGQGHPQADDRPRSSLPQAQPDAWFRPGHDDVDSCVPHPSIEITERHGWDGFTWTNPVTGEREYRPGSGVVDGDGTAEDPYVIEGWCIPPNSEDFGIRIEGTRAHATVRDNLIEIGPYPLTYRLPVLRYPNGIELEDAEHVAIENNVIRNNRYYGVKLYDASDVTIENNTLENQGHDGMNVAQSRDVLIANNSITRNVLDAIPNFGAGVRISSSTGVTVTHNNLGGHGPVGLLSWSGETHNIRNNWWGAASGPSGGVVDACTGEIADGDGNEIHTEHPATHGEDGSVCFDPWLTEPADTAGAG